MTPPWRPSDALMHHCNDIHHLTPRWSCGPRKWLKGSASGRERHDYSLNTAFQAKSFGVLIHGPKSGRWSYWPGKKELYVLSYFFKRDESADLGWLEWWSGCYRWPCWSTVRGWWWSLCWFSMGWKKRQMPILNEFYMWFLLVNLFSYLIPVFFTCPGSYNVFLFYFFISISRQSLPLTYK